MAWNEIKTGVEWVILDGSGQVEEVHLRVVEELSRRNLL